VVVTSSPWEACLIRLSWIISSELHLRCSNEEPLNEDLAQEPGPLQEGIDTEESGSDFAYAYRVFDNEDILLELDGSNNIVARYTHGPGTDEPLIMEKGGASFFYHADGLGSITEITNSSGTVAQRYSYSSFGKIESQVDPSLVQPYTFTAREFDSETGLYFYRARYYDPPAGRFLQEDPFNIKIVQRSLHLDRATSTSSENRENILKGLIGRPQNLNQFVYLSNDPINFVDPLGLWSVSLEGYWGWGGGIVIGRNPNGTSFLSVKFGYGFGGGFSYDPFGTSPGYNPCLDPQLSFGPGGFAELGIGLGPVSGGVAGEGGVNIGVNSQGGFLQPYSKAAPKFSLDAGFKLRAMAASGVQVNFVGLGF
jgi:RHS repeat-associated protein